MHLPPHVARRVHPSIDVRATRHPGYALSQRVRKQVEEIFGWVKTVGEGRKMRYMNSQKPAVGGADGGGLQSVADGEASPGLTRTPEKSMPSDRPVRFPQTRNTSNKVTTLFRYSTREKEGLSFLRGNMNFFTVNWPFRSHQWMKNARPSGNSR
jgi:hypothetical protein